MGVSFWPDDLFTRDVLSPQDIMDNAGKELATRTQFLSVEIREAVLEDRTVQSFVITNTKNLATLSLFDVYHRTTDLYPVVIDPPRTDIPVFLQRERRVSRNTFAELSAALTITGGSADMIVRNEWVCATPAEFSSKLKELFTLDSVKSKLVSLMASTSIVRHATVKVESLGASASIGEHRGGGGQEVPVEGSNEPPADAASP
jgi:hypothetical protein